MRTLVSRGLQSPRAKQRWLPLLTALALLTPVALTGVGCTNDAGYGNLLVGRACDEFQIYSDPQCVCCPNRGGNCVANVSPCAPESAATTCGGRCPTGMLCRRFGDQALCASPCQGPSEQSCGNCGRQTRTCLDGVWTNWGACTGEGECIPNAYRSCAADGTQTCEPGTCQWGPCQACPSGPATQSCGRCGTQQRLCESGKWLDWGVCDSEGSCTPGTAQACGNGGTQVCSEHCQWSECSCSGEGLLTCGGRCVDTQSDRGNCGTCGTVCGSEQVCSNGDCQLHCVGGTTKCSDGCVDTMVDPAHCGACDAACASEEVCAEGKCQLECVGGTTKCGNRCPNTTIDPSNCGGCGIACSAGLVCSAGTCQLQCAGGTTKCTSKCVNISNDPSNCGGCGIACGSGQVCSVGVCQVQCGSGTLKCSNRCVDLTNDPTNCGACGTSCPTDQVCSAGLCQLKCSGGTTKCGARCVDTSVDSANCSGCGITCAASFAKGSICSASTCTCPAATALCEGACQAGTCLVPDAPSCKNLTSKCQGESCCTSIPLPGGTFAMGRSEDSAAADYYPAGAANELPEHQATVAPFALDKYEVTVGRFRKFMAAYDSWHAVNGNPTIGAGAHPSIAGTGWGQSWAVGGEGLPADAATLRTKLEFTSTCTEATGVETDPVACVKWYVAFAFCIWDGGRLPTEAEWEYAAAGGNQNFLYPWGKSEPADNLANYAGTPFVSVGSRPAGAAYWGHQDLAGSLWELTFDWLADDYYAKGVCVNCANTTPASARVIRGGSCFWGGTNLRAASRGSYDPIYYDNNIGFRCARAVP